MNEKIHDLLLTALAAKECMQLADHPEQWETLRIAESAPDMRTYECGLYLEISDLKDDTGKDLWILNPIAERVDSPYMYSCYEAELTKDEMIAFLRTRQAARKVAAAWDIMIERMEMD